MKKKPRLILVSGWGHPPESLQGLADTLKFNCEPHLCLPEPAALQEQLSSRSAPCFVAGWSLGGIVALQAALEHPEKISGLILMNSTPCFCATPDFTAGVPPANLRAMTRLLPVKPQEILGRFFTDIAAPFPAADLGKKIQSALSLGMEKLTADLHYLRDTDLLARTGSLLAPCLLIHGKADCLIPWQASRWLSKHIKNNRFVPFPGIGHDLPLRRPNHIGKEILLFVEDFG